MGRKYDGPVVFSRRLGFLRCCYQKAPGWIVKSPLENEKEVHLYIVVTAEIEQAAALPPEFTLRLGPKSVEQLASLARVLKDLGARVEVEPEGALVAIRPH
ncbi:hypothetical protein EON82_14795 [bacterium]|nr:MAG: hypothetical protein EON82_14795 [bacterium]